jgi:methylenetetrahydrofolate dehydrogenase (NADP+) / methenyltetrahydrofolate cyclohydrolase
MKTLSGTELVGYIKERQAKQVRALRQASKIMPRLAIVRSGENPVIDVYVKMKCNYGDDILIEVDVCNIPGSELIEKINELNTDKNVHAIIVQLPLENPELTDMALITVAPEKDVDGLGDDPIFTPATAMAIDWLLAGYNVDLANKKIAIVGKGRLVGGPLAKMWRDSGYDVTVCDRKTADLPAEIRASDVIVTATGVHGIITSDMVSPGAVVVDAGTAAEHGKIVGDLADDVREREDITITPTKGGVGPLTVSALFDNVINAALKSIQ